MGRMLKLEVHCNGRAAVSLETERPELILEFLESFYLEPWWDRIELRQGPSVAPWIDAAQRAFFRRHGADLSMPVDKTDTTPRVRQDDHAAE